MEMMRICRRIARTIPLSLPSSSFNSEILIHTRAASTIPRYHVDLSRIKKVSDAVSVFDDMLRMQPRHSIIPFNQLLSLVIDMEGYTLALHMFDKMRQCSVPYNEYTLSIVINCYCLMNRVDLGFPVLGVFCKSGLVPNVTTFNTFVNGLVLDCKGSDAVLLFKKLFRGGVCEPDEVTFNTVIDCYCRMYRVDLGFSVFGMFFKSGFVPNVTTFSTLIKGLLLDGKEGDAVLLFKKLLREDLCEPGEVTLNTVIHCYFLMNRVDLGFSVLSMFFKSGLVPNVITFNTLIKGLFLDNRVTDAVVLFKKLSRQKVCEPDEVTFSTVIDGLCKFGNVHIAACLLSVLVKRSCKTDVHCYSPIIDSFCKDGMFHNALRLFSKMVGLGITPDVVTCNSIIQGLCDFSRWKEAKYFLHSMIRRGVLPSLLTYNILIDAFCKHGNLEEAKSVLAVMLRKNVTPDIVTYSALIYGYCYWGEIEKGRTLFHLISHFGHQPNIITYTTMLHGLFRDGLVKEAMNLFVEMENYGLQPNVMTFTTIIGGLCQNGLLKEAKRMFVEMEKRGCVPNHVTYFVIIRNCLTHNVLQEAQPLLDEMKSKGLSLEAANVHMLFDHCIDNGGDEVPLYMIRKIFQLN